MPDDRTPGAAKEELLQRAKRGERGDVGFEERIRAWAELRGAAFEKGNGRRKDRRKIQFQAMGTDDYAQTLRIWRERVRRAKRTRRAAKPAPPALAPATNWIPIGPSVVRRGQAVGAPPVSGRTVALAIAPGGMRVYAATANGGVWRSDDGGTQWRSLLDNWDKNPTTVGVDSQACGAIAIDPAAPDRVYVGTGEGEGSMSFGEFVGVVFSYAGVGVLRTDDGGDHWTKEPVAAGSPDLNGHAFYHLVLDPVDRERVVAATTAGIYLREPDASGGYHWRQTRGDICTSVAVARAGGVTTFFAAMYGGPVLRSTDGCTWTALEGYPAADSRVSLAVQPTNPDVVYAFSKAGVHRYDASNGQWHSVSNTPSVRSDYMASIAVDPTDVTRLYFGGIKLARGVVSSSGGGAALTYSLAVTSIGSDVHPDIHRLVVRDDAPDELWVACDGGVFRSINAPTAATFQARNTGLATMTCTYIDQHPTEAAVMFVGAQDNGTLRYTGEEAWLHSDDGDGGANVVNWNDPYKIIRSYIDGFLYRTSDGGQQPASWSDASPLAGGALFYPPLVGTPPNPASPADADIIALGASSTWFSPDFGTTWSTPDTEGLNDIVSALVFRSATELYAGTITGCIYRYTRTGSTWAAGTLIGQVGSRARELAPIVTDIAIDPTGSSAFYVSLGGQGDWRRVWHYDGSTWAARSGPSATSTSSLLPVHFNALVVDPANPQQLFAGADIGIWRSVDGGLHWTPYEEGLPDAGVVDLQLHPTRRLLRAATYGRGVYEREIDAASAAAVELYVRDTDLDLGRWPTVDGLDDPEVPNGQVHHWAGPNIKVDPPSSAGTYQTPSTSIDFLQFVDQIIDGGDGVATRDPTTGTVVNRVYVEVHNRGVTPANAVQVMLLVTNASAGLPPLPTGYTASVQSGTSITTSAWKTVGIRMLNGLAVGSPQVAEFDLPSTLLPSPSSLPGQSHYCILALLHSPDDIFTNTQTDVDSLAIGERKAAHKNLHIVAYTASTEPGPLIPMTAMLDLNPRGRATDLLFDLTRFRGLVTLVLPKIAAFKELNRHLDGGDILSAGKADAAVRKHIEASERMLKESRSDPHWTKAALEQAHTFLGSAAVTFAPGGQKNLVGLKNLSLGKESVPLFLILDAPGDARVGDAWEFDVVQADSGKRRIIGGCTYHCRVTLPPDDTHAIELETRVALARPNSLDVLVKPHADGKTLTRTDAEVDAVMFTAAGTDGGAERLKWNHNKNAYVLRLSLNADQPVIRRLTVRIRTGDREVRKTIELPRPA